MFKSESAEKFKEAIDSGVIRVFKVFDKIGTEVAARVDFEGAEGSPVHEYVWNVFGPGASKEVQTKWIKDKAFSGKPETDEQIRGEYLNLSLQSADKIVELLK